MLLFILCEERNERTSSKFVVASDRKNKKIATKRATIINLFTTCVQKHYLNDHEIQEISQRTPQSYFVAYGNRKSIATKLFIPPQNIGV